MQIAVISDIHGNCVALDAVLEDLKPRRVNHLVCLGDAIQGGPQPKQVIARLHENGCPVVMGNADAWLLSGGETGEPASADRRTKLQAVRVWSLAQLNSADRAFIGQFQPTVKIEGAGGAGLLCFHGSPASSHDIILPSLPEDEFRRLLEPYAASILAGGHTHLQQIRRIGDHFFFNPGSVGVSYRHEQPEGRFRFDPWAEYAVLTLEPGRTGLEFRRVPFDAGDLIEAFRGSGRPYADEDAAPYEPDP